MLFSSMTFLWILLPIIIIVNYLINLIQIEYMIKIRIKNIFLLFFSLLFYGYGKFSYLCIMLVLISVNYIGGILISKKTLSLIRTSILIIVITINLLVLFYFKYFNMVVIVIEQFMEKSGNLFYNLLYMKGTGSLNIEEIELPIGISFFTFQAMSYVIDVYRREAKPQYNLFNFALYVSFFPQLIAGPIVKYTDIEYQMKFRVENFAKFLVGQKRFIYGLAKKVILANTFASIVDEIWKLDISNLGASVAIFGSFCYAMQIYYDFSGYSDMAIGLGKIFGFDFKENFNMPYMSKSITEFWRRWHISLSTWFREYVYIPLGGNRKGKKRTYINLFIVFILTGIWHGANFTFIIWGILYGIILVIERKGFLDVLNNNRHKFFNWIYTISIVNLLWIIFRAPNIVLAIEYLRQFFNFTSNNSIFTYLSMKVIIVIICSILCMGVIRSRFERFYIRHIKYNSNIIFFTIDFLLQYVLLIYSILSLINGTYNPFIYFQF